MGEIKAYTF